ncbi:MAG: hypothetical protein Fur0037_23770 [Planctomycetota bacterium]
MVRILCNLPLECFAPREEWSGVELVTFGPGDRMLVDGVHFPFDIEFDPSTGSFRELEALLPRGFRPDFVLLYWPDQEPLPAGLQHCPFPVVGVVSDYNLTLPWIAGLWPFFDVLLCDRRGVDLFAALSFADVRYFCQYTFKKPFHRIWPDAGPRDIDIGFAGNLNPVVQRERAPWIERIRRLADRGVRVDIRTGVHGADYGRFLNRCRIGFDRSIRGEMNLRAFEVPACGAALLIERENLEVADFLEPGEECVLYGDDLEDVVLDLLADPKRLSRIAERGHQRIQHYSMGRRLEDLAELLSGIRTGRPRVSEGEALLARATAMAATWASGPAAVRAALDACERMPSDPRPFNLLGLATLRWRGAEGCEQALQLWRKASALDPHYVPAAVNAAELLSFAGREDLQRPALSALEARLGREVEWRDLDGPCMPLGFSERAVDRALALGRAVLRNEPPSFARALASGLLSCGPAG